MSRYFVTDCQMTAAKHFKPGSRVVLDGELLVVEPVCKELENKRKWQITLRTKFQPGPKVNAPYFFVFEIVGFFDVAPTYPMERVEMLVKVNGPSVLYGITREVVRDLTSRGPYPAIFLPSVSFMPSEIASASTEEVIPPLARIRPSRKISKGS